jgi:hypothetical protein
MEGAMPHRTRPRAALAAVAALSLCLAGSPATAAVDAWPLYQHDEDGTTVLYPVYVHEGDFLMVAPFYYRTNQARDHHLLWPLVKLSEGRLVRAAPIYFSEEEDEFTLFPLIRQTPSGTLWMLPPAYFSRTSDFSMVFPLYAHSDERTWVLPNLYLRREGGELVRAGSWLVLDWERKAEAHRLRLLHLMAGARWGGDETGAFLVPVGYLSKSPDVSRIWVGPVYRGIGDGRDDRALLPFYGDFRSDDDERHTRWIGTWYLHEDPHERRQGVVPLYTTREERHPQTGATERSLSLLAWLYSREVTTSAAGERIAHRRRFLALTDSLDASGRRTIGLFGLPIWERTREGVLEEKTPAREKLDTALRATAGG